MHRSEVDKLKLLNKKAAIFFVLMFIMLLIAMFDDNLEVWLFMAVIFFINGIARFQSKKKFEAAKKTDALDDEILSAIFLGDKNNRMRNQKYDIDKLKLQFKNSEFHELIEEHTNKQSKEQIVASLFETIQALPERIRPLIELFIDRWNVIAYEKSFWHLDTSDVFIAIENDAKELFQNNKVEYTDNDMFYMFQIIVLNFAHSAVEQPKMFEFMKEDVSLAAIKEAFGFFEFNTQVEPLMRDYIGPDLVLELGRYSDFFTPEKMDLVKEILNKWNKYGLDKEFWHLDTSEVIDRLECEVHELFKNNNLSCTDTEKLYIFQMIILKLALLGTENPEILKFIKSESPKIETSSLSDKKEDVRPETLKIEKTSTSDIKNAYLETCKSRNNNTQFRELVRLNFTENNIDSIVSEMAVVSISLSPDVMPLTETVISKWVEFGKKKGFWDLNGSRLFDLFDKDTRTILDNEKVKYNDNDIEYLFQYLLLVFAGSALNDIANQKFMGIE